jgi:protein SCO1/2
MKRFLILSMLGLLLLSCDNRLPVIDGWGRNRYKLVNQNNKPVIFPDFLKGKIVVLNFIFTNCPDICPINTNNMRLIQERLKKEKITNVEFVSLSFDPGNDTPEVLTKFAMVRNLDLSNWTFLTGDKTTTNAIISKVNVIAVPSDSTIFKDGRKIYYYIHTDRISLIDTQGRIRKNYLGSKINIDEIVADLKTI